MTALSPFDYRIKDVVFTLQSQVQSTVQSREVASFLRMPERTVRYYLRSMEARGMLFRPLGLKSGYSAMPVARPLGLRDDVKWKARQISPLDIKILRLVITDDLIASAAIADALDCPIRTVRYHLKQLEELELVHRPCGPRSGYRAIGDCKAVFAEASAQQILSKTSPFDIEIVREVEWIERYLDCAAGSKYLAGRLDIPSRSMRYYLRKLENLGLLHRPDGLKSGYRVNKVIAKPVLERAKKVDDATLN